MPKLFSMIRDASGYNGFGLEFCENNFTVILTANAQQSFVVPVFYRKWLAIFSFTDAVWVSIGAPAVLPTSSFVQRSCQLNPSSRLVSANDTVSLITSRNTNVECCVSLYGLN